MVEKSGISSLFKINVQPGSKAYRYDVEVYRQDNLKSFTKASDEYVSLRAMNA